MPLCRARSTATSRCDPPLAVRLYAKTGPRLSAPPFRRVLVANRGEIALRIIRACREMGMESVAVYSDADARSAHVRAADQAVRLGPAPAAESYLRGDLVIAAAVATNSEAIHPGYGFLAERAEFVRQVDAAGLTFVGPSADAMAALGDKIAARAVAVAADVPVVPGTFAAAALDRPDQLDGIVAAAEAIGFPLMVKSAAGGGGRGMRRVTSVAELPEALIAGARESAAAFGDGSVYMEREIRPARHVEVQLLGDAHGHVVAIGERDCSIQRRHQKLVEESPAPGLTAEQRRHVHELAVRAATAARLTNAATAEFLLDPNGNFWFLEVNARLQVEHGVTELVSDLDLVREQFWLAAGHPLSPEVWAAAARAAEPSRHAIEVRISAEDPARAFAPTAGRVVTWRMPAGPGVRVDTAVEAGDRIPPEYDPMIAKQMVVGPDRGVAIERLRRALDEVEIGGLQTTLPFDLALVRNEAFMEGRLSTDFVADHWDGPADRARALHLAQRLSVHEWANAGEGSDGAPADRTPGDVKSPPALAAARHEDSDPSAWGTIARDEAVDRWPR